MYNAVEQNLRSAMRCYANVGENSEVRDYPEVTVTSTGLDVAVFNSAMLRGPTNTLDPAIVQADVHFRARRLGWTFWVCEDLVPPDRHPSMRLSFRKHGLRCIASPPGLFAERLLPPERSAARMTFATVSDDRTRLEFAHIASVVFSLAFATSKKIYGSPGVWMPPSYGWIGYFNGKPVSVVTVVIANDVLGVYSLGTLPQYQRSGFGETLLRHALNEAANVAGTQATVLQATPEGSHLYLRMGYSIVTKFSIYIREGAAF